MYSRSALRALVVVVSLLMIAAVSISAQEDEIKVEQLADNIYKLYYDVGYIVKVIASVGPDGILLVDVGDADHGEQIKAKLAELHPGTPKFIVLTHEHAEHVAGGEVFGLEPIVIGHKKLRHNLTHGSYVWDEFGPEVLPDIAFRDTLTLHFNGEVVKIIEVSGAHTDDDIMVWFTGSKVACVGAVSNGSQFPSVDSKGDIFRYAELVKSVIELLPEDTKIVPGHGPDHDMEGLEVVYQMLINTWGIVKEHMAEGKDVEAMAADSILRDYDSWQSYTTSERWIRYFAEPDEDDGKEEIFEPLYRVYKAEGAEAAVAKYTEMKATDSARYDMGDIPTVIIPYKLYLKKRWSDAMVFARLYVEQFPEGTYVRFGHNVMAECCEQLGDIKGAIEHYETTLELGDDEEIRAKVDSLKAL